MITRTRTRRTRGRVHLTRRGRAWEHRHFLGAGERRRRVVVERVVLLVEDAQTLVLLLELGQRRGAAARLALARLDTEVMMK